MLRKSILTGLLMFIGKGSLLQLVIGMVTTVGFLCATAWFQPYVSRTANVFKVSTEVALLMTLLLCVLLRVPLETKRFPGGEAMIGVMMVVANVVVPVTTLALALLFQGLDVREAIKSGDEIVVDFHGADKVFDTKTENPFVLESE